MNAFAASGDQPGAKSQPDAVPAALASMTDAELISAMEQFRAAAAVVVLTALLLAFLWSLL